jgi:hypothetical protein
MNNASQEAMQAEIAAKQAQLSEQQKNPQGTTTPVTANITNPSGGVGTEPPVVPMDTSVSSNGTVPTRSTFDPNFSNGVNNMNQGMSMGDHMFKKHGASIAPFLIALKPLAAKLGAKIAAKVAAKGGAKVLAKKAAKKAVINAASRGKDDSKIESTQTTKAPDDQVASNKNSEKNTNSGYSGSAMYMKNKNK